MIRRPLLPALLLGALVALTACGGADGTSAVEAGADPTPPASTGTTEPVVEPTWPADCDSRASSALDYGREPRGWKTPEEAVQNAANGDIPAGELVLAPAEANAPTAVYVVDATTNTILAAVSVFPGSTGFYVDGVTTCA